MKSNYFVSKSKKMFMLLLMVILVFSMGMMGCTKPEEVTPAPEATVPETPAANGSIILSTTTSTQDSGLLDAILPDFTQKTGVEVKVVAVGSGKAIQMGIDGEADVLLVHARADEDKFVADGHGPERFSVMHNDFVLVGPSDDPAKLKGASFGNAGEALKAIMEGSASFISRGDDSGTHKKELSLWKNVEITPVGDQYISTGKGMGDVLQMASELQAYTMTDRATYLSMKDTLELEIVVEGLDGLLNPYGVIAVNPDKNDLINSEGAQAFIEWILSAETQELIANYGISEYGAPLFFPDAK